MFLIDTDHLSFLQRKSEPESSNILRRMSAHTAADFFTSIVSFQEQIQGWQSELGRSKSSLQITYAYQRLKHLLIDYAKLNVLEFDQTAAQQVEQFRKAGIRIGTLDLRIASIAITFGFTVLTRNVSDFRLVPGLQVEDWSQ